MGRGGLESAPSQTFFKNSKSGIVCWAFCLRESGPAADRGPAVRPPGWPHLGSAWTCLATLASVPFRKPCRPSWCSNLPHIWISCHSSTPCPSLSAGKPHDLLPELSPSSLPSVGLPSTLLGCLNTLGLPDGFLLVVFPAPVLQQVLKSTAELIFPLPGPVLPVESSPPLVPPQRRSTRPGTHGHPALLFSSHL